MKDPVEVRVLDHDVGPPCEKCRRKMSTVEFVGKVPAAFGAHTHGHVCFACLADGLEDEE